MSETFYFIILALVGFIAGIINTLAGGGSLLTLPMLIFLGLPPAVANGTNRIGIFLQSITSVMGYKSKGIKPTRFGLYMGLSALFGSILGAQIAIEISGEIFNKILAIVMLLIVFLIIYKPNFNLNDLSSRVEGSYFWISILVFFCIGIYGGFIQAGVGMLLLAALTSINNMKLVNANATKVLIVFIYTIAALGIFAYHNQVNYLYGFILAIGNASGGWVASRWSVNKGDRLVKIFLGIMVIIMAIKLWFK